MTAGRPALLPVYCLLGRWLRPGSGVSVRRRAELQAALRAGGRPTLAEVEDALAVVIAEARAAGVSGSDLVGAFNAAVERCP